MHNLLAVWAGLVAVAAAIPYIRDTLQRKTRPNLVTWFTWTLLNIITAIAAFAAGAKQTAIFASALGICTGLVVIAGLRDGLKKYTVFDAICQVLAIVGIVLWRLTNAPDLALLFTISASFIGSLPTYRHAWKLPGEETWQFYALDGFSAVVAIASVSRFNFAGLGYPVYIVFSDYTIMGTILTRLRVSSAVSKR
jgi:hypothetical protein